MEESAPEGLGVNHLRLFIHRQSYVSNVDCCVKVDCKENKKIVDFVSSYSVEKCQNLIKASECCLLLAISKEVEAPTRNRMSTSMSNSSPPRVTTHIHIWPLKAKRERHVWCLARGDKEELDTVKRTLTITVDHLRLPKYLKGGH